MRLAPAVAFVVLALHATQLAAQTFAPGPGAVVNGQVSVQVMITLRESADDYEPIPDHVLMLCRTMDDSLRRSPGDSLQFRTDDAGVLRFLVAPGLYHLVSASPATWRRHAYWWNVPIWVHPGMGVVQLTTANASMSRPE